VSPPSWPPTSVQIGSRVPDFRFPHSSLDPAFYRRKFCFSETGFPYEVSPSALHIRVYQCRNWSNYYYYHQLPDPPLPTSKGLPPGSPPILVSNTFLASDFESFDSNSECFLLSFLLIKFTAHVIPPHPSPLLLKRLKGIRSPAGFSPLCTLRTIRTKILPILQFVRGIHKSFLIFPDLPERPSHPLNSSF